MANEDPFGVQPARWLLGPPAPRWTGFLARACSLVILIMVGHWVRVPLGGVGCKPIDLGNGSNDTSKLFNWHPVLMTLAFVIFMAEALLSYQSPIVTRLSREARKKIHWGCHLAACTCALLGLAAVLQSHRLSRPVPMPDWYSPHSYLGLTALSLVGLQVLVGLYSYVWPRLSLPHRLALGPVHRFWGMAAWLAGLGAVATGLQEKATFMQKHNPPFPVYGIGIRLPAAVLPLLVVLAALVLYLQAPGPSRQSPVDVSGTGVAGGGGAGGGVGSTQGLLRHGRAADGEEDDSDEEGGRRY